jgi:hypothetical protein
MFPSQSITELSNRFYSLIPHVSYDSGGGTRARLPPINTVHLLKEKIEMIEALGASLSVGEGGWWDREAVCVYYYVRLWDVIWDVTW